MPERLVGRINEKDTGLISGLYLDNAAHVTGERTVVGKAAVRTWYDTLLTKVLPNAEFKVTGKNGSGITRQFTWTARSDRGSVLDGNDTLGLRDGRDPVPLHLLHRRLARRRRSKSIDFPSNGQHATYNR